MVRAFHWQYGDILLAIYFFVFTYYFVLSLKNKYTILMSQNVSGFKTKHEILSATIVQDSSEGHKTDGWIRFAYV